MKTLLKLISRYHPISPYQPLLIRRQSRLIKETNELLEESSLHERETEKKIVFPDKRAIFNDTEGNTSRIFLAQHPNDTKWPTLTKALLTQEIYARRQNRERLEAVRRRFHDDDTPDDDFEDLIETCCRQ